MHSSPIAGLVRGPLFFLLISAGITVAVGCGPGVSGTQTVPPLAQTGDMRHVSTCTQGGGSCVIAPAPTAPPESPCNPLSPGSNCASVSAPPTPNPIPEYIDQDGMPCDPLNLKLLADGKTLQVCTLNPAWDSPGTPLVPVFRQPLQPQCSTTYGVLNRTLYHQCYAGSIWIN